MKIKIKIKSISLISEIMSFEDEKIKILSRAYNKKLQSSLINRRPNSQSFHIANKLSINLVKN